MIRILESPAWQSIAQRQANGDGTRLYIASQKTNVGMFSSRRHGGPGNSPQSPCRRLLNELRHFFSDSQWPGANGDGTGPCGLAAGITAFSP